MIEAEKALGQELGDPEQLRDVILEERIEIAARPELSLRYMFESTFVLARMLADMQWAFRESHELTPLITSDSPIVLNNPTVLPGEGPPNPAALEVVFPVSPELLFVATWDGHSGTGPMSASLSGQVNKMTALAAERYVYSPTHVPALPKYLAGPRKRFFGARLLD